MFGRLNARKPRVHRFALLAVLAVGVVALTVSVAGATLKSVGPTNPNTGYPTTFTDNNNVTLEHCLDNSGFCLEPPPNPDAPASTPENIGEESFWWTTEADLELPSGGTGLLVLALEGAFANDEIVDGDQVVFGRVRLRGEDLIPGRSYVFTHPYGSRTLTADADGRIRFTEDIGCFDVPCDRPGGFSRALDSNIGPFLRWDPAVNPQAPAGYLGNPNVEHRITGSPTGTNLFRVARTGAGSDTAETNLFAVSGKLATGGPTPAPDANLNPTSLNFGNQTVDTNSAAQTSTLSNTGNAALNITSISDSGPNAADFTTTENCPASLPAGQSCTITVVFRPSATGARTATVTVADNDNSDPGTISLAGNGVAANGPNAAVNPDVHDFGTVTVGSSSAARTSTLSNTGNAALTISSIADDSAEYTTTHNCPASLAAGQNCTVTTVFSPTSAGTKNATVTVTDNDPDATTIALTGVGEAAPANAPQATFTPASLVFAARDQGSTSPAQTVTVGNNGNANLVISTVAISGANAGDFAISGTTCTGATVTPEGPDCTVSVTFTPSAAGSRTATLTVNDNDNANPGTVPLSGTGNAAPAPGVNLSAANLAFPNTNIGTTSAPKSVTLTNNGTAPLSITGVTVVGGNAGDFAKAPSSTCGSTLAAGASCQVDVTFTPSAAGSRSSTLRFATNAGTHDVGLHGTGVDPNPPAQTPAATVNPSALQFGGESILLGTLLGTDSETRFVSVTSAGTAPLAISAITITGANPGDFRVASNTCTGAILQPGANCVIGVVFHPTALGTRSALLNIASNAPAPIQVGLGGKGMLLPILV